MKKCKTKYVAIRIKKASTSLAHQSEKVKLVNPTGSWLPSAQIIKKEFSREASQ
jgi:hypothetical protein